MSAFCFGLDPATPGGNTSFLLDRNIPESLDFAKDSGWAKELATVKHDGYVFQMFFEFSRANATSVELVLFNCPDWGIGAVDIVVKTMVTSLVNGTMQAEFEVVGKIKLQNTSCDRLLTVRLPLKSTGLAPATSYTILFPSAPNRIWTHIAEVTFYGPSSLPDEKVEPLSNRNVVVPAVVIPVVVVLLTLLIVAIILVIVIVRYKARRLPESMEFVHVKENTCEGLSTVNGKTVVVTGEAGNEMAPTAATANGGTTETGDGPSEQDTSEENTVTQL